MPEEEDDLLPELPAELDGMLGDDEPFGDEELGLDGAGPPSGEERIGLDDSTGLEDEGSLFALELPPDDAGTDEDGVDAIPVEGLDGDDEYGWTDDGRRDDEPWDPAELDLPGLTPLARDDGGEEGVDEGAELGLALPPLRESDEDEDADDLAFGEDALIAELASDTVAPPMLSGCRVEHLGPESAVTCFEPGPPTLAAGSEGLFAVRDHARPIATRGLEGEVVSIAASETRIVLGTRDVGALRSDDGASFVAANAFGAGRDVTGALIVARERGADRIWALTQGGALFRSDDFGTSWVGPLLLKTVIAIATPREGGLLALSGGRDAPQLARSEDGGQRWSAVDAPPLGAGAAHVDAVRDSVVVAFDGDTRGPFLSNDRGKSWTRVPGVPPAGPIALAWEPGGLALYAAHVVGDRALVLRHRPAGGETASVLELAEGERVLALHAGAGASATVLHAATTSGLYRVHVDPDGAP